MVLVLPPADPSPSSAALSELRRRRRFSRARAVSGGALRGADGGQREPSSEPSERAGWRFHAIISHWSLLHLSALALNPPLGKNPHPERRRQYTRRVSVQVQGIARNNFLSNFLSKNVSPLLLSLPFKCQSGVRSSVGFISSSLRAERRRERNFLAALEARREVDLPRKKR